MQQLYLFSLEFSNMKCCGLYPANTALIYHHGKLLALQEADKPCKPTLCFLINGKTRCISLLIWMLFEQLFITPQLLLNHALYVAGIVCLSPRHKLTIYIIPRVSFCHVLYKIDRIILWFGAADYYHNAFCLRGSILV